MRCAEAENGYSTNKEGRARRPAGRPTREALLLTAGLLLLTGASRGRASDADFLTLESAGDKHAGRAADRYRRAYGVFEQIARRAAARKDEGTVRRCRESMASLAALLLDRESYASVASPGGAPPRSVAAPPGGQADLASLDKLARLLSTARRRYPSQPEAEERDLPLIGEGLALVYQLQGDISQAEADALYLRALKNAEQRLAEEPSRLAAAIRMRYKLRDFPGAWTLSGRMEDVAQLGDGYCDHLRVLRNVAAFLGKRAESDAFRDRLSRRCPKKEQSPRAAGRLGSLLIGSRADLVASTNGFVALLSSYRLTPRESALAALFAAAGASDLGEFALTEELLRGRAEAVSGDPWLQASILSRLSWARDRLGNYEAALRAVRRAKGLVEDLSGTSSFLARLELNEARILLELGKHEEALRLSRRLVARAEIPAELGIRCRLLAGSCLYELSREEPRRLGDALGSFRAAERAVRSLPADGSQRRVELEVMCAVHLANVLRREAFDAAEDVAAAKRREAISLQDAAMRRAHAAGLFGLAAIAASNLGELHLEGGNLEGARGFVKWALDRADERGQFETRWRCHWYLGRIAAAETNEELADRELATAMRVVESYRERILDAEAKSGFMSDKMDLFRFLAEREISRGRPERALEVAERSRARALVESLGWRFVSLADARETRLYREYISLVAREARLRRGRASSFLGAATRAVDSGALRKELQAKRNALLSLPDLSPTVRALVDGAPATAEEILGELDPQTALIEYFDLGSSMVAFIVEGGRVEMLRLGVKHGDLRGPIGEFIASGASDSRMARRLHALVAAPVEERVSRPRVIIVPYGVLHRLPFEALQGDAGLQIARWEISYLPSASLLKYLRWNRAAAGVLKSGMRLVAFADPDTDYDLDGQQDKRVLEGARREVEAFAPRFSSRQRQVLFGKEAAESALRGLRRGADVLHIACHGEFYATRPWDSTLFLARTGGTPENDGLLRAYEVYGLDMRGRRLVALSGCETGVQGIAGGDDPAGIATAFLHSGASSLLVSLWKVEDKATAALMESFYRKWIVEGRERAAALREAKLELLRGSFGHPRQWASFVLIAEG